MMDTMFISEAPRFDALIDGIKGLEEKLAS
jgi:hypothetical protein